jgi:NADPH:quinone reductase
MRAIVVEAPGAAPMLADINPPKPGRDEVLVRVEAASLNPVDWKLAETGHPAWTFPHVLGLDAAGVVVQAGPDVVGFTEDDRVVWHGNLARHGVFAEYAVAPWHVLSRIPSGVDFVAAASVPCAGYTAWQALMGKARIAPCEHVLIQGAAGAVGGFGVQIARQAGSHVIALARPDAFERVRALGADVVLDTGAPDLADQVRAASGGNGCDVFLEIANPGDARLSLQFLRFNGHLLVVDPPARMEAVPAFATGASVHEVALGAAYLAGHLPTQRDFALIGDAMMDRLARGKLDPLLAAIVTLPDVPDALNKLRRGGMGGKIVAVVGAQGGRDADLRAQGAALRL